MARIILIWFICLSRLDKMNYTAGTGDSKDGYSYPAKSIGNTNCNYFIQRGSLSGNKMTTD